MIAVVDYGMGNLHSVRHALERIGAEVCVTQKIEDLQKAERIILPGVGAFGECMKNIDRSGLLSCLQEQVIFKGKPFLGICLGMQVLAREGYESGNTLGLNWIPGIVERFEIEEQGLRVPHVGWNEIRPLRESSLFQGIRKDATFYFVHSFHFLPQNIEHVLASCEYGIEFAAALQRGNILATQFHPEKSQENGLKFLENFLNWKP